MSYHSLGEFVDRLEGENELVRITDRVSPILEIAEITELDVFQIIFMRCQLPLVGGWHGYG